MGCFRSSLMKKWMKYNKDWPAVNEWKYVKKEDDKKMA